MTWSELTCDAVLRDLISRLGCGYLVDGAAALTAKDQTVAWKFFVELRTRITTQDLHFLDGDEQTAVESLHKMFQPCRELLAEEGPASRQSTALVEAMLNRMIRPFTAKWHRQILAGSLLRDDACRELRAELRNLQIELRHCERLLYAIATDHLLPPATPAPAETIWLRESIPYDQLLGLGGAMAGAAQSAAMIAAEQQEIAARRQATQTGSGSADVVGLAVSGGGIRSATFALGVVQGLVNRGMLRRVDLMSTVSGGGYLGSFLSSLLNDPSPECGPTARQIPFRPDIAGDSAAIRALRNNSRYILPSSLEGWLTTLGQALYGVISNLVLCSTLVFAAVLLTALWMRPGLIEIRCAVSSGTGLESARVSGIGWLWSVGAGVLFLLPLFQRLGKTPAFTSKPSGWEWLTIVTLVGALGISAVWGLPFAHYAYMSGVQYISHTLFEETHGWSFRATWVLMVHLAGLLAARSRWLSELAQRSPLIGKVLFVLLWLAGPALLLFVYFELCRSCFTEPIAAIFQIPVVGIEIGRAHLVFLGLMAGTFLYSALLNVNLTSLHRFYRNRLAETYLLCPTVVDGQQAVKRVESLKLTDMRKPGSQAPYHLVNAALNLQGAKIPELRDRNCDFFVFSKHYCGSPVAGYFPTEKWAEADAHLDLGTAMAISGAAAAPQMGLSSTRNISFLLALLNVRLGYWLRKPSVGDPPPRHSPPRDPSFHRAPGPSYLVREALGRMSLQADYLNVTDGGHIENLAIYELLRRRCRFIIAIDGECDPGLNCPSLMRLQELAAVDLQVRIEMDVSRLRRGKFQPAHALANEVEGKKEVPGQPAPKPTIPGFSRGHFSVGHIVYPGGVTGWLIYIKLSVTGNEPDYVLDYLRRFPEFPHQTTGDQVFEEEQFEAYRCLGEHIVQDLFSGEILPQEQHKASVAGTLSLEDWCQQLVNAFFRNPQHPTPR